MYKNMCVHKALCLRRVWAFVGHNTRQGQRATLQYCFILTWNSVYQACVASVFILWVIFVGLQLGFSRGLCVFSTLNLTQ